MIIHNDKFASRPVCLSCLAPVSGEYACESCNYPFCDTGCARADLHADNECTVFPRYAAAKENANIPGDYLEYFLYNPLSPPPPSSLVASGTFFFSFKSFKTSNFFHIGPALTAPPHPPLFGLAIGEELFLRLPLLTLRLII